MNDYGEAVESASIRIERLLPGPIERVWAYITDVDKRATWLAGGKLEPHVGGRTEHVFRIHELTGEGDPHQIADRRHGQVLDWDPPRLLRHTWSSTGEDADSEVTFTLESIDDKVRLIVTHRRLPTRDEMISIASGWHAHLDILQARLEHLTPEQFWPKLHALQSDYETMLPPFDLAPTPPPET
ncbi:SRPBCC family protein [Nocardia tengchongensis]|uniref:SRPBCC family protein n=1 Tax=Nocardia tengchongensis TaxID=2055889 RepID=UPI0036AC2211